MRKWITLTALLSQTALAQSLPSLSRFQQEIREYNYFTGSPATFASICVKDTCLAASAGNTDYTRKQTVDAFSLSSIGSLSKYMTAILTLRLIEQDYLRLEDTLSSFFPAYAHWEGVTVQNLLQHSSGIPDYLFTPEGSKRTLLGVFNWHQKIWRPEEVIDLVIKEPSVFPVGTKIEYNNTNFVLLGMILEKVTRRSLDALFEREIFGPLGMRDTYLSLPASQKNRRVAGYLPMDVPLPDWFFNLIAHRVDKKGAYLDTTHIFDPSLTWSAGGMVSTAADLSRLTRALFTGKLLSPEMLEKMRNFRAGTVLGMPFEYGLGLMRQPSPYGDLMGHGGLTPGYHALSNYLETRDQVISLVQNIAPAQANSLYYDLVDQVQGEFSHPPFIPDPALSAEKLENRSLHFRLRGKITAATETSPFFTPSFGFLRALDQKTEEGLYQTFSSSFDTQSNTLILRALSAPFPLYSLGNNAADGIPFIEIRLADDTRLYQGRLQRPGSPTKSCLLKVLDTQREAQFQLQADALEPGQTIKFAGNFPFREARSEDLLSDPSLQGWEICKN